MNNAPIGSVHMSSVLRLKIGPSVNRIITFEMMQNPYHGEQGCAHKFNGWIACNSWCTFIITLPFFSRGVCLRRLQLIPYIITVILLKKKQINSSNVLPWLHLGNLVDSVTFSRLLQNRKNRFGKLSSYTSRVRRSNCRNTTRLVIVARSDSMFTKAILLIRQITCFMTSQKYAPLVKIVCFF